MTPPLSPSYDSTLLSKSQERFREEEAAARGQKGFRFSGPKDVSRVGECLPSRPLICNHTPTAQHDSYMQKWMYS